MGSRLRRDATAQAIHARVRFAKGGYASLLAAAEAVVADVTAAGGVAAIDPATLS